MSQAFVKESEGRWLHDISPTLSALVVYLTGENNGIRVYEKRRFTNAKTGSEIYEMSNGLLYTKDKDGRWEIQW